MSFWHTVIETDSGAFGAIFSARGLCRLTFPARPSAPRDSEQLPSIPAPNEQGPPRESIAKWRDTTTTALRRMLQGQDATALLPLLAPEPEGTPFQQSVWDLLRRIPRGQCLTYGEVARRLGRPGAARAVGSACGANPIPLLIPCHRVLAAAGRLGGFTAGLEWKRRLLALEGVTL